MGGGGGGKDASLALRAQSPRSTGKVLQAYENKKMGEEILNLCSHGRDHSSEALKSNSDW